MHKNKELPPWAWTAILLTLVCLPRVSIDIYLPSLPAMADALRATDAQMQLTLTLYMAGSALSMLLCGPLADRYGRRPVMLAGTVIYLLATLSCVGAQSAPVIIAARLFQALGGCSGTLIGRVMVRDRFAPEVQAGMLSRISMGMALSPVVAPLIGSLIALALGWRGVFATLAAVALLALAVVALLLPETRPPAASGARPAGTVAIYLRLLRDAYFLRYALAIGFVYCTYFPFIAESSLLLQRTLHLSASAYALVFGATVTGYLIGSNLFRRLHARHGADRLIGAAVAVNAGGALLLLACTTWYPQALAAIVGPMLLIILSVGVAIPACQFAVLQPYAAIAGTASGLFFFIQMAITTLCGFVVGQMSDGSARPMAWVTAAASAALCAGWLALRGQKIQRAAPGGAVAATK